MTQVPQEQIINRPDITLRLRPSEGTVTRVFLGDEAYTRFVTERDALRDLATMSGLSAPWLSDQQGGGTPRLTVQYLPGKSWAAHVRSNPRSYLAEVASYVSDLQSYRGVTEGGVGWKHREGEPTMHAGQVFAHHLRTSSVLQGVGFKNLDALAEHGEKVLAESRLVRVHGDLRPEHVFDNPTATNFALGTRHRISVIDWRHALRGPTAIDAGQVLWDAVATSPTPDTERAKDLLNAVKALCTVSDAELSCGIGAAAMNWAARRPETSIPLAEHVVSGVLAKQLPLTLVTHGQSFARGHRL